MEAIERLVRCQRRCAFGRRASLCPPDTLRGLPAATTYGWQRESTTGNKMGLSALTALGAIAALAAYDLIQKRHATLRRYAVIGHVRYGLEKIRPEVQQYFIERNWDGRPFDRDTRSLIYERAKGIDGEKSFGTERDVYEVGHEYLVHAIQPAPMPEEPPRVTVGGPDCSQPYSMSLMNVSAMSFGALSKKAVLALNKGAATGDLRMTRGRAGYRSTTLSMAATSCGRLVAAASGPATRMRISILTSSATRRRRRR